MPSPNEILAELKKIKYPGFTRDIVSFGMIKDIEVGYAGVTIYLIALSAKPEAVASVVAEVEKPLPRCPAFRRSRSRSSSPSVNRRPPPDRRRRNQSPA